MVRPSITAFVFDFGGVLIDWNPRYLYRKLARSEDEIAEFLFEIDFHEWNQELDRGAPFAESTRRLVERFPHRREWIEAFHQRWRECLNGPIEGTVALVHELKSAGYPLSGLSNWSAETFAIARRDYPFLDLFDDIVLSGEEKVVKPDPEIFRRLLKRLGRRATECLVIDDSPMNIAAAAALGFDAILFQSPEQLRIAIRDRGLLAPSTPGSAGRGA